MQLSQKKISGAEQKYADLRLQYPVIFKQLELLTQPYQEAVRLTPQEQRYTFQHSYLPMEDIRNYLYRITGSAKYLEQGLVKFFNVFSDKYDTQVLPVYSSKAGVPVKLGYIFTPKDEKFTLHWIFYYLQSSLYYASAQGIEAIHSLQDQKDNYNPLAEGMTSQKFNMYKDALVSGDIINRLTALWLLKNFFSDTALLRFVDTKIDSKKIIFDAGNIPEKGFMIDNMNMQKSVKYVLDSIKRLLKNEDLTEKLQYFRMNNILSPETLKMYEDNLKRISIETTADGVFIDYKTKSVKNTGLSAQARQGTQPKVSSLNGKIGTGQTVPKTGQSNQVQGGLNSILTKVAKGLGLDLNDLPVSLEKNDKLARPENIAPAPEVKISEKSAAETWSDIVKISGTQSSLQEIVKYLPSVIKIYWNNRINLNQTEAEQTYALISAYLNSFKQAFEAALRLDQAERRALCADILNSFDGSSFFELQKYFLENLSRFIYDFEPEDKVHILQAVRNRFFFEDNAGSKVATAYKRQNGRNYFDDWTFQGYYR